MYARVAWSLVVGTVILEVGDTVLTAQSHPLWSEESVAKHGWPFVTAAVIGASTMGALIVSRYPRHPIGWLLSFIGFTGAISLVTEAYSIWVIDGGGQGSDSMAGIAGWISALVGGTFAIAAISIMFLVAPDGHLLSRRWRYAAASTLLGFGFCTAGLLTVAPTSYRIGDDSDFSATTTLLLVIGFILIAIGLVASAVSMVRRLLQSHGEQRQQLRLIALSATLVVAGVAALILVSLGNGGEQTWAAGLPLFVAYFLLPILFAFSVLRYRLYEIEVIVSRAFILAVGTAFAALGYTALVVGVGAAVGTQTSGFWLSLLAIVVVALAFQPLRRRVVHVANRLAFGARAAPYEALSAFSRRLGETPSPEALLPAVAEAAGRAVSARRATAALQVSTAGSVSATWPLGAVEGTTDHTVVVRIADETLGRIAVELERGHNLRATDLRLLQDLADQAALAFRNAALETDLAIQVAALDRSTQELAASRRRIIEANDSERRRIEAAISRDVLPHLVPLPTRLDELRDAAANGTASDGIGQLITQTQDALESLRTLTRGVFPTQLVRTGLAPSLKSLLTRTAPAATLLVDESVAERRFPARVECAVYFCCVEALHAGADSTRIELLTADEHLVVLVQGVGRDSIDAQAMVDRVEAAGGSLWMNGDGSAETLELRLPVSPESATQPVS